MADIDSLIAQMTLEEKASLCSGQDFWRLKGIERLNIPAIMVTDGPHGLRKAREGELGLADSVPATCFPTASALAATWNRDLVFQVGQALGEETRAEKVGVILGPGANIKRSPLCGRNFEYFSEDPFLSGEMAKSHIRGVQSQGVGTSLKHFVANNQEHRRMSIDAVIDERALREIYLAGFEIAVREAQPWTVMCAYNKVNGIYNSEHRYLMNDILKEEWGHQGLVVTDWGAMNDRVQGLDAGVELEMPGAPNGNDAMLVAAVQSGELDEAVLDRAVRRILTLIFKAEETLSQDYTYDQDEHHALARRVAGEGAVLLKNEDDLLPLARDQKIALIGRFAKEPRYQGAGSSLINPTRLDNIHDEMVRLVGADKVRYAPGYTAKADQVDDALIAAALEATTSADVVVVCVGLTDWYEVEGVDRNDMKLPPAHDALIQSLTAVHPRVIVVLSNGSPVEMPWAADVPAILEGYLAGQAGAGALVDILYGKINPSGKLAETFPVRLEDTPCFPYFPGGPATVEYRESIYVGYRYYDTVEQDVLFPFGHGLSYTTFEYSDLRLAQTQISDAESLDLSLKVKNTGAVPGKEIVQVYIQDLASTWFRPQKELKGFQKVELAPGEEAEVRIKLPPRAFAYYNPDLKAWHIESGEFDILVGASSRDIRLQARVTVQSSQPTAPPVDKNKLTAYFHYPNDSPISQHDFEALLGRPIPANKRDKKGQYTINTPLGDMKDSFIGRQLYKMTQKQITEMLKGQEDTPTALFMQSMIPEMPLRAMLMMSEGAVTRPMLDAMLKLMNGHYLSGGVALVKSLRRK